MSFELAPIVKQAELVRALVELAVGRWSRRYKFTHGDEIRQTAKRVEKLAHMAWRQRSERAAAIRALSDVIDEFKLDLQLAKRIDAFTSLGQFEEVFRATRLLGQQCGGWLKEHSQGQNAAAPKAPPQRAAILSTRDASREANP